MKRALIIGSASLIAATAFAQAQDRFGDARDEADMPEQQYGWQRDPDPIIPEELDRPLTELEQLSVSASGMQYGRNTYDPRTDNPLEPVSVTLRALDKITARYTDLVIDMDAQAQFGTLAITPRTCDKRPPEEVPEVTAFLEIHATDDFVRLPGTTAEGIEDGVEASTFDAVEDGDALPPVEEAVYDPDVDGPTAESVSGTGVQTVEGGLSEEDDDGDSEIFSGWMFASSPALNALEHPVYDVWVIDCKMVDPSI